MFSKIQQSELSNVHSKNKEEIFRKQKNIFVIFGGSKLNNSRIHGMCTRKYRISSQISEQNLRFVPPTPPVRESFRNTRLLNLSCEIIYKEKNCLMFN